MEQRTRSGRVKRTERINIRATPAEKQNVARLMEIRGISEADAILSAVRESLERGSISEITRQLADKLQQAQHDNRRIKRETGQTRDYLDGVEVTLTEVISLIEKARSKQLELSL